MGGEEQGAAVIEERLPTFSFSGGGGGGRALDFCLPFRGTLVLVARGNRGNQKQIRP